LKGKDLIIIQLISIMKYSTIVDLYEKLAKTSKKIEKRDILADFYRSVPKEELELIVNFSMGSPTDKDIGIADELVKNAIAKAFGIKAKDIINKFKTLGDLGLVAEYFSKNSRQMTLLKKKLTVKKVYDNIIELSNMSGKGSQSKKISLISELLISSSPREAKYIIRTIFGYMRIGVAKGIVRDAIAKAFNVSAEDVEHAYDILNNYGKVAYISATNPKKLGKVKIIVGSPLRVMLAQRAKNLREGLEKFEHPCIETKYDGFRTQIHKDGKKVWIFSRRLEDVTKQFPDLVKLIKKCIKANKCIIEGETIAIDKNGKPLPFQKLSKRIQRKYDIEMMTKKIPIQINLFDLLYVDGKNYMNKPLRERWKKLKKIVNPLEGKLVLANHIETKDYKKAEEFYKWSLSLGEEGVMIKNLDAIYNPGKRVGFWLKVKPIMDTLDLVIIGAEWGSGKRTNLIGSYKLAAKSDKGFLPVGMMGSGLTDKQLKEMTEKLKKNIVSEKGREIIIKPKIIVEVAYEEIQKSPNYSSGYALRFPRLVRIRYDRSPENASSISDIEELYKLQRGRGKK